MKVPHSFVSDELITRLQQRVDDVEKARSKLQAHDEAALSNDLTFDEYLDNRMERQPLATAFDDACHATTRDAHTVVDFIEDKSPPDTAPN